MLQGKNHRRAGLTRRVTTMASPPKLDLSAARAFILFSVQPGGSGLNHRPLPPAMSAPDFYAHTHPEHPGDCSKWERLEVHLKEVADLSADFAAAFGAEEWGRLAGRWHDLGKFSEKFQQRLQGAAVQVEHTGAGAALAKELVGAYGETLAFVIAGHHAGLCNRSDRGDGNLTPLDDRVQRALPHLAECRQAVATLPVEEQARLLPAAVTLTVPEWISCGGDEARFRWHCFIRMLFAALVDADSIATERFCDAVEKKTLLRAQQIYDAPAEIQTRLDTALDALTRNAKPTAVNGERARILQWCREAAVQPRGFFTLNVPTGGGKTLASMSFALRHVVAHREKGMRRVIVAVPYTSIIEQNAKAYADYLGAHNVVEHHSNLDDFAEKEENDESTLRRRLACENWDAPVIVTTNVQLFESLFTHKRSRARKLHNIAGSVIILDEAQCVPLGYLALIVPMLRELVEHYGCTVVISTATQPAWKKRKSLPFGLPEEVLRPVIPPDAGLSWTAAFDRVSVEWPQDEVKEPYAELAVRLAAEPCVLTIVHLKKDAQALAGFLKALRPGEPLFHLSTNMCPAHRREVLVRIREAVEAFKENGTPCRVVSTQLVEAGVDLDFPVVYRAMAGVDSIAQAAGRCNREGKLAEKGRVVVFHAETDPPDGHLRHCAAITNQMITESQPQDGAAAPAGSGRQAGPDLRDPKVYEGFFVRLYMSQELDKKKLLRHATDLNFETLGTEFRIIEELPTVPVVVLYDDEARARLAQARGMAQRAGDEKVAARFALRALQPYTVAVWPQAMAKLAPALDKLFPDSPSLVLDPRLLSNCYDSVFGIVTNVEPEIPPGALNL